MSSRRWKTGTPPALLIATLVLVLLAIGVALTQWTGLVPAPALVADAAVSHPVAPESEPRGLDVPEGPERPRYSAAAAGIPSAAAPGPEAASLALMAKAFVVRGRVVDAARNPVPGADVSLGSKFDEKPEDGSSHLEFGFTGGGGAGWTKTKTDAYGRFRFAQGGTRDAFEVQARSAMLGVAASELSGAAVAGSDVDFGDIVLGPALELRGQVLRHWSGESFLAGEPFAGVEVELRSDVFRNFHADNFEPVASRTILVVSAIDGSFVFEGLLPGRYQVVARVDELGNVLASEPSNATPTLANGRRGRIVRPAPHPSASTTLPSADSEPLLLLVPRRTVLRGQVTLPDGRAVIGAEVEALGPSGAERTQTNGAGRFEITGLGRAPVKISVWPPKDVQGVLRETELDGVVPGAREVRVVLASSSTIEGVVVGADELPVAFAGVTATSSARKELDFAYTDEQGRFRLRVPPDEAIELDVCPTRLNEANVRTLDRKSPLRAHASRVRAGVSDLVLRLGPK